MAETRQADGRFRRLVDGVWVAPQLRAEDFAAAAALGIRTVINNRPDGEAPDQLPSAEAERAARESGLAYVHLPVVSGAIFPEHVRRLEELLASTEGPWLLYCRSGTRSCHLWALAACRRVPPAEIVEAARRAGYDLSRLWPVLEAIRAAHAGREEASAQA